MSRNHTAVRRYLSELESCRPLAEHARQTAPRTAGQLAKLPTYNYDKSPEPYGHTARRAFLRAHGHELPHLTGTTPDCTEQLRGNIENFIGMAQIPVGLAGPLLVNGTEAQGDFLIPLATTEGTLVASYNRGMKACREAGGISSVCLMQGVQRSPFFKFRNIGEAGQFVQWVHDQLPVFHRLVAKSSRHAQLHNLDTNMEGNSVILTFEYGTGDAAGQNMVTVCTDRICRFIVEHSPFMPGEWYLESNYSGDKKATALSFSAVRGKKMTSEVLLPESVVRRVLKTTPEAMARYWQASTLSVVQSGAIGAQGHIANGLTALFIACGQDVACISESSIGLTRMELNDAGDLYVAVTLPSLIVGTVGGGTGLPTQRECLELMDCYGVGKARKLAEICCAVALAGELSIAAALAEGHFCGAHERLGRKPAELRSNRPARGF